MSEVKFRPRMLGIVCNWCCYGGADLCGVSRFQYPAYIKLMRVMCSGRVEISHIIRAFSKGADGVFVGGCHLGGDCHYITEGNYDAYGTVQICKKIMEHIGVNPDRLRIEWVSAGEGIRFANIMNEFSSQIERLGPLGKVEDLDEAALKFKFEAVLRVLPYVKLVERERLRLSVRSEEAYHKYFKSDEFNKLFSETILENLVISEIVSLLKEKPRTTGEIAKALNLTPSEVSKHLAKSTRHRFVRFDEGLKAYGLA